MLPWWAGLLFLATGFVIGIVAGRALGLSQAMQQMMGMSLAKQQQGMPNIGGLANAARGTSQEGSPPRA